MPVNNAALAEVADRLADQAIHLRPPDVEGQCRPSAFGRIFRWAMARPLHMGRHLNHLVAAYGAAVGADPSTARADLVWAQIRLVYLGGADCADREKLVRGAARRLLVTKATGAEDMAVSATEQAFSTNKSREIPPEFRSWPVERRTEWFRESNRNYAEAWRAVLEEHGDVSQ